MEVRSPFSVFNLFSSLVTVRFLTGSLPPPGAVVSCPRPVGHKSTPEAPRGVPGREDVKMQRGTIFLLKQMKNLKHFFDFSHVFLKKSEMMWKFDEMSRHVAGCSQTLFENDDGFSWFFNPLPNCLATKIRSASSGGVFTSCRAPKLLAPGTQRRTPGGFCQVKLAVASMNHPCVKFLVRSCQIQKWSILETTWQHPASIIWCCCPKL